MSERPLSRTRERVGVRVDAYQYHSNVIRAPY